MAFKIYKKNNYIIIEDTIAGKQYQGLAKNVFVYKDTTLETIYDFEGLTYNGLKGISFSDLIDETNTPFVNEQAFINFYTENTGGFNSGGAAPSLPQNQLDALNANATLSGDNAVASMADIVFASTALTTNRLNFLSFVTVQADKDKILANNASQTAATMSTYLTNAIAYCKTNNIKMMYFPSGTYKFNGITIDNLDEFYFVGDGAVIKENNLTGTTALLTFTNCNRVSISGFNFIGTYGSYADYDFINISTGSGSFKIYGNTFKNWRRSAILISALNGGVASEGCNIYGNEFLGTSDYTNNLQSAITLGEDGEYCRIHDNFFKAIPCALRATNGANTSFYDNNLLSMAAQGFDSTYNRALIYIDNSGTNNGKIDILNNKINHNASGITAIVIKGVYTAPQNASKIIGNDIMVHGSTTNSNAVYIQNAPFTIIKDNKLQGNATISSSGIILDNCPNSYIDGNFINNQTNGFEIKNTSLNVKKGWNMFNVVTNQYINDGSSSWI